MSSPQLLYDSNPFSALEGFPGLIPDIPVPRSDLEPLVEQLHAGYRCADLLLLLPGDIPIPSFSIYPSLPSPDWVDPYLNEFLPRITDYLREASSSCNLYPSISFPSPQKNATVKRSVIRAPLIVRPSSQSIYTSEGRSQLLSYVGVPSELHDPNRTKILVVSFGGQIIRTPSRPGSRQSQVGSRRNSNQDILANCVVSRTSPVHGLGIAELQIPSEFHCSDTRSQRPSLSNITQLTEDDLHPVSSPRLATPSHIWIPGAPPASKPTPSPINYSIPTLATIPPTPDRGGHFNSDPDATGDNEEARLLPDASWIAIVCGVTKEQWLALDDDQDSGLPDGFFVAPKDVYMPDLTAVGDVLLGKLVSSYDMPYEIILFRVSNRVMALYRSVLIHARPSFTVSSSDCLRLSRCSVYYSLLSYHSLASTVHRRARPAVTSFSGGSGSRVI
jgi:hypothetical protein